jgi:8-oxo-dGTP pyrophosphatase MutT (NUDIX family)
MNTPGTNLPPRTEHSAGGIVFKLDSGAHEPLWLICKHSGYHKWVFPKGLIDPGETIDQTALREVREETGIEAEIIAQLPEPETYIYTFSGQKVHKRVDFFLMWAVGGSTDNHDFETEDVRWVTENEVFQMLGYELSKNTFQQALELYEKQKK